MRVQMQVAMPPITSTISYTEKLTVRRCNRHPNNNCTMQEETNRMLSTCIRKKKKKTWAHSELTCPKQTAKKLTNCLHDKTSSTAATFYGCWEASSNSVTRDPPNIPECFEGIIKFEYQRDSHYTSTKWIAGGGGEGVFPYENTYSCFLKAACPATWAAF